MSLRHRIIPCIKHHVGNLVEKSSHFRLRNPVYKKLEVKVKEHINVVYRDSCDSNITPTFTCEECKYFPFDTEEESELYRNELLRRKSKAIAIVVESLQEIFDDWKHVDEFVEPEERDWQEMVKQRKGK